MNFLAGLTIQRRMLGGVGLLLVITVCIGMLLIGWIEKARFEASVRQEAEVTLAVLEQEIVQHVIVGDYGAIEQGLRERAKLVAIDELRFIDADGRVVAAINPGGEIRRPAWFAQLLGLDRQEFSREIAVGGARYGQARILYATLPLENALWQRALAHGALLAGALLAIFFVIRRIIADGFRPLSRLIEVAGQIREGNSAARVIRFDAADSPEMARLLDAFNGMAEAVEEQRTRLAEEKDFAEITLHAIGDGVITTDAEGRISDLNTAAARMTGWSRTAAIGVPLGEVYTLFDERSERSLSSRFGSVVAPVNGHSSITARLRSRVGEEHVIEDSIAPIRDRSGQLRGAVLVFRDVTQARRLAEEVTFQATHDGLTGLVNRAEFERRVNGAIDGAQREMRRHALLYMDLDQFKIVNDTCGHMAGDALLRQLGQLLEKGVREADSLGRLGGDEFGLLLLNCPLNRAELIAAEVIRTVCEFRFSWADRVFAVGVSIGLVEISGCGQTLGDVLSGADAACYWAKDKGRARFHVFKRDDQEMTQRHGQMEWVARITLAFEERRFRLAFQPIVPLAAGRGHSLHYEILLYVLDENGVQVPPMAFIPAAERYGIMPTVDRWVVRTAFAALRRRAENGHDILAAPFSINLSGPSLGDDLFLDFLLDQFAIYGVAPAAVCFEVTETAAIANLTRARLLIDELRAIGCRFSLDDFGSGLSSFAYLKNLHVDFLKIDGTFVKDMANDPIDEGMVRAINEVGHLMQLQTVAEYVEDEAILERLRILGVDYGQGHGIARPMPLESMPGVGEDFFRGPFEVRPEVAGAHPPQATLL